MSCEAGRGHKTSTLQSIFIVTSSLEGWSNNAKRGTSGGKTEPTGHQPSISMSQGCH